MRPMRIRQLSSRLAVAGATACGLAATIYLFTLLSSPISPAAARNYYLIKSIEHNDVHAVDAALDAGAEPNATGCRDIPPTLLNHALGHDKPDSDTLALYARFLWPQGTAERIVPHPERSPILSLLLCRGADPNTRNGRGETPLMFCGRYGHNESVRILLLHHADANLRSRSGWSAIQWAAAARNPAAMRMLLPATSDISSVDYFGQSPLMTSVENGSPACVRLLLDSGANTACVDKRGWSALDEANALGENEIALLLRKSGARTGKQLGTSDRLALPIAGTSTASPPHTDPVR
jgi:hypothetical protein